MEQDIITFRELRDKLNTMDESQLADLVFLYIDDQRLIPITGCGQISQAHDGFVLSTETAPTAS